jgi:hypothetical protein
MAYYTKTQMTPSRTTPTLANGSAATGYVAPYYYQDVTGRVYFGGALTGQTGATLFTLPAGMRPVTNYVFLLVLLSGGGVSYILVATSGAVAPASTTAQFWDGASFLAGI